MTVKPNHHMTVKPSHYMTVQPVPEYRATLGGALGHEGAKSIVTTSGKTKSSNFLKGMKTLPPHSGPKSHY
jgi:hypothetical protein